MNKISTRSNALLTQYIRTTDKMKSLAYQLKELERKEKELRPAVLQQIDDDPRPVTIAGALRIVRRDTEKSVSIVDQAKALEYAKTHGLKITPAKGETVSTQTLRARAIDGVLPEGIVNIDETPIVVVT